MFKIIHISDLHVYGGPDPKKNNATHSIAHMKGVESIISKNQKDADLFIISGDISNYGDSNSLLLVKSIIAPCSFY